ncbi:MAG: Lrp/AsnC family transcriptional regulator [Bosea sp. (in: a-proteobacteria)]
MRSRIDEIDRKILRELQADGRLTNVELAQRIGMSPPPCLRRVRALEEAGIITRYRAELDAAKLGFDVAFFAFVQLISQSDTDIRAFEARVRGWPQVRASWKLSGDMDFILSCLVADMPAFQSFVEELTGAPAVRQVRTSLVLGEVKDMPAVPV